VEATLSGPTRILLCASPSQLDEWRPRGDTIRRPAEIASKAIGTGPFKFVEFKPNQSVKVARNPDYWRKGRPYLDGIEYTIIANRSTALFSFIAGKFDMTFPYQLTVPLLEDVRSPVPQTICELRPTNLNRQDRQSQRCDQLCAAR
jgi:ABC-type transport system substrate-binding protein